MAARRLLGGAAVAAVFLALLAISWRRWPDVLVDFGRELYVPTQLARGKVLYRDIAHISGPLSQHVNAGIFWILGPSLAALAGANLLLLAAVTAAIFAIFARIHEGSLAPTVACLTFLVFSGFSHATGIGNYNFVCPYAHELTHGTALGVLLVLLLGRWLERGSRGACALGGLVLGLTALTKPEPFVAAVAVTATAFGIRAFSGDREQLLDDIFCFLAASVAPALVFYAHFRRSLDPGPSLRAVLGAFAPLVSSDVASSHFYVHGMGLDQPGTQLLESLAWTRDVIFLLLALVLVEQGISRRRLGRGALGVAMVAFLIFMRGLRPRFLLVPQAFTVVVPMLVAASLIRLRHLRRDPERMTRAALEALWAVFALALLLKISLRTRAEDYGFALAMPATVLLATKLVGSAPRLPDEPGRKPVLRALLLLVVLVDLGATLSQSAFYYRHKVLPIGRGPDTFLTYDRGDDPRGADLVLLLERIEARVPEGATLVVLPEGVMLNYLSRRTNPTPYLSFMPPEVAIHGEATMLAALEASAPDFVVLAHRWTGEYGVDFFGDPSYGKTILDWVHARYERIVRVDHAPFEGQYLHGYELLRRR